MIENCGRTVLQDNIVLKKTLALAKPTNTFPACSKMNRCPV